MGIPLAKGDISIHCSYCNSHLVRIRTEKASMDVQNSGTSHPRAQELQSLNHSQLMNNGEIDEETVARLPCQLYKAETCL